MCYPNSRIRSTCIQIIFDLHHIETDHVGEMKRAGLPLAELLVKSEASIVKAGMYGFLETSNGIGTLKNKIATSLKTLSFLEVAASSFTKLFQFYLGELVKRFSSQGRTKGIRHLAQFMQKLAAPLFEAGVVDTHPEYRAFHFSNMMLLMCMAGVPVTDVEVTKKGKVPGEALLFGTFKPYLTSLFLLENHWTGKGLFKSLYFLHRDIYVPFLFVLRQNFQNIRLNAEVVTKTDFIDNSFCIMRYMIQQPQFENILEESREYQKDLVHMFVDFIGFTSFTTFSDTGFLECGPKLRLKSATNYCIIVQILCRCLYSVRKRLVQRAKFENNNELLTMFDDSSWQGAQRRSIIIQMKDWAECITSGSRMSISSAKILASSTDHSKLEEFRKKLLYKISLAAEQTMNLGGIFLEPPLPTGLLVWFAQMEGEGFRVFTPELQFLFEDALGTTLASSYGGAGRVPFAFTSCVFEQILPRLDDSLNMFLFSDNRRMSFAESFISISHSLPQHDFELNSSRMSYPEMAPDDAQKLRRNLGSLLFYGIR
jgi:hypothetical protein